jgi:osmoprotectant transport system ATP-binding protein
MGSDIRSICLEDNASVSPSRAPLAADPPVILLDEPFGALDALTRLDLQTEFLRLKSQLGKTLVFVTHDLREAFRLSDRIAVLRGGHLLQVASAADLAAAPADAYVTALLEHAGVRPT